MSNLLNIFFDIHFKIYYNRKCQKSVFQNKLKKNIKKSDILIKPCHR